MQCAYCGGGKSKSELLDASWCMPSVPVDCNRMDTRQPPRLARSPPWSALLDDSSALSRLSLASAERPMFLCDAATSLEPGLMAVTAQPGTNMTRHVLLDGRWSAVDADSFASQNENGGMYLVRGANSARYIPGDPFSAGYTPLDSDPMPRPYLEGDPYTSGWGLEYLRSCPSTGQDAQVLPTVGSCYSNQPPYWVDECHYENVCS